MNSQGKAETIILNTRGTADDISPELRSLLDFVDGKPASEDDPFLFKLEERIRQIKNDQKWRHNYMIMSAEYMDARREGREEGREEGHERTTFSNIRKIMKNLNVTSKQAMTILELSEKEQAHFEALLKNSDSLKMNKIS